MAAHGGADRGRSHGGGRADDSSGPTDVGGAGGGGARGGDGELKIRGDAEDPEGQGGTDGTCDRGRDPESRTGDGGSTMEMRELGAMVQPQGRRAEAESEDRRLEVELKDPPDSTPTELEMGRPKPTPQMIWRDARTAAVLKERKIRTFEDLTQSTKDTRNKLWPLVERARKEGKRAGSRGPFAYIDEKRSYSAVGRCYEFASYSSCCLGERERARAKIENRPSYSLGTLLSSEPLEDRRRCLQPRSQEFSTRTSYFELKWCSGLGEIRPPPRESAMEGPLKLGFRNTHSGQFSADRVGWNYPQASIFLPTVTMERIYDGHREN
ncbi:hypothetical protein QQF64_006786 [Cirrhinus molitorella]|uniref:Uncharacterized protein n=1 Tax=Cirrhinus molitorella TaxID=172907 RepID=A0ABR3MB75_9TELE